MADEYLEEWKQYCEQHEKHAGCKPGCVNIHPVFCLRWIKEIEQMTAITQGYMKEVIELREEITKLKTELSSKSPLQQENGQVELSESPGTSPLPASP